MKLLNALIGAMRVRRRIGSRIGSDIYMKKIESVLIFS
jgi:hypothetical protein